MNLIFSSLFLILCYISKESNIFKEKINNAKINTWVSEKFNNLMLTFKGKNGKSFNLKLIESGTMYLNKSLFDCDDKKNDCEDSKDIICDKNYKPKKSKFIIYNNQKDSFKFWFCYTKDNLSTKNEIGFNFLEDKLRNKIENFNLEIKVYYTIFRDKVKNVLFNLHINSSYPDEKYLIDQNSKISVEDKTNGINLEFNKIDFGHNFINNDEKYEVIIETNDKNLLKIKENLEKGLEVKGSLNINQSNNKSLISSVNYDKHKIKIIESNQNNFKYGFNVIMGLDFYIKYEKGKVPKYLYYKSISSLSTKTIIIIVSSVLSAIVLGVIIYFVVVKFIK